jgi:hypothetical protein
MVDLLFKGMGRILRNSERKRMTAMLTEMAIVCVNVYEDSKFGDGSLLRVMVVVDKWIHFEASKQQVEEAVMAANKAIPFDSGKDAAPGFVRASQLAMISAARLPFADTTALIELIVPSVVCACSSDRSGSDAEKDAYLKCADIVRKYYPNSPFYGTFSE